jgi:hypothetical protein
LAHDSVFRSRLDVIAHEAGAGTARTLSDESQPLSDASERVAEAAM